MLRIRNWKTHFENNRTKELKKLEWVPVPNRLDGDGYTELVDHPDGAAHFGAWIAIVEIASKCDVRGTLSREGATPHDARSLARISRLPAAVFEAAIPRLLAIGWLEETDAQPLTAQAVTEIPQCVAEIPQVDASSRAREKGREWNGREGNGTEPRVSVPPIPPIVEFDLQAGFSEVWELYPKKGRTKIMDSQRFYVDAVLPDPARIHSRIVETLRPGGKWAKSEAWAKQYIPGLSEWLRNMRWLEDPPEAPETQDGQGSGGGGGSGGSGGGGRTAAAMRALERIEREAS